ncbi:MAG: hypothetical protein ACRD1X_10705 [Vicinamibacteria bacterium]
MRLPGCLTALAVASLLGACQARSETLPEEMLGHWTTDAHRYEDRFFELDTGHLTFGTGGGSSYRNPILRIEVTQEDGRDLYHLEHQGAEGQSYTFSFYYQPANSGIITLKNQTEIHWTKERRPRP